MAVRQPLWELCEVSKAFPGVQALDRVSLRIFPGEVHALLGENGSGKSTLAKCLTGAHQPDTGTILMNGKPVALSHPLEARAHGVAAIYQEFSLVPTLTVAENVYLGRPMRSARLGLLDWEGMRRSTSQVLGQLALAIAPDTMVRDLSVAEQQLVEIAKAVSLDSTLLIMDEPTAALGLGETQRLLALVRDLAAQGKAILYISHRLDEVFRVADRVTVLKDGVVVGSEMVRDISMDDVVRMMVGLEIDQHYPKQHNARPEVCLEVRDLRTENGVNGVSFDVHVGEVLGLGGMVGSGRTEIARALFGLDRPTAGEVSLYGVPLHFRSPVDAIRAGVGLVPENRKADGLFYNFEGPPNITISRLRDVMVGPFLSLARERQVARAYVKKLSITPSALNRSVQYLSGGNQQKVMIARWLYAKARLLIMDEPTQGIDIGAKLEVYQVINELTSQGIGIILISSDYPELLAMSDRIAVVRDGRIVGVAPAQEMTEHELLSLASGANGESVKGVDGS